MSSPGELLAVQRVLGERREVDHGADTMTRYWSYGINHLELREIADLRPPPARGSSETVDEDHRWTRPPELYAGVEVPGELLNH
ncbi:jg20206 [Pararge aegeria aegeria]|uniref:Jg20206 protein n=1 Tax=Pararge aegeria aegeria TaxID=348720 RepID=A0A8S4R6P9_9NEOP|nr:jg20206 [Pararge aegeria aegeria]